MLGIFQEIVQNFLKFEIAAEVFLAVDNYLLKLIHGNPREKLTQSIKNRNNNRQTEIIEKFRHVLIDFFGSGVPKHLQS